jgi:hypothetical protein
MSKYWLNNWAEGALLEREKGEELKRENRGERVC